ncbi:MAG TPA: RND transporter, partial [Pseudomonas sp.]|nr:RND transporter [Pseudomonas sp.]
MSFDQSNAPFMERLVFNNRLAVVIIFSLVSLFLGYQALQVRPDTSFAKMIPLEHPYIVNMLEHQNDLANLGNSIRIAVAIEDGDIFSTEYMETLKQINDEVFFLPGVDRSNLRSLWTPNVR